IKVATTKNLVQAKQIEVATLINSAAKTGGAEPLVIHVADGKVTFSQKSIALNLNEKMPVELTGSEEQLAMLRVYVRNPEILHWEHEHRHLQALRVPNTELYVIIPAGFFTHAVDVLGGGGPQLELPCED